MDEAAAGIAGRDAGRFGSAVMDLRSILGPHNVKEERILYPMVDEQMGGACRRDDLVRRLQALDVS